MAPSRQYKIRLASGRVLGPLDRDRIRKLIRKRHLTGSEVGREYPDGEWVSIGQLAEIADLFLQVAQTDETGSRELRITKNMPALPSGDVAATQVLPSSDPAGPTVVNPPQPPYSSTGVLPGAGQTHILPTDKTASKAALGTRYEKTMVATQTLHVDEVEPELADIEPTTDLPAPPLEEAAALAAAAKHNPDALSLPKIEASKPASPQPSPTKTGPTKPAKTGPTKTKGPDPESEPHGSEFNNEDDHEPTRTDAHKPEDEPVKEEGSKTRRKKRDENSSILPSVLYPLLGRERRDYELPTSAQIKPQLPATIADQETIMFESRKKAKKKGAFDPKEAIKATVAAILLGIAGYQLLFQEPDKKIVRPAPVRPQLPVFVPGNPRPAEATALYKSAMASYAVDTVMGYRNAADKLRVASGIDRENVRPLAMLASSYLNLIDSSNKDEKYFSVISTLIDMTRAKGVDLPETMIADVEFYLTINKADAAEDEIVRYTRSHQTFPPELYYYLALTNVARGDYVSASRNLQQFPNNMIHSPKIFYLRGYIAEKLNDPDSATRDYLAALKLRNDHAKSHLRLSDMAYQHGQLGQAAGHLEFIVNHPLLLAPRDLALGYYLHSQLAQSFQKMDLAIGDLERAVRLDPENHDYLLDLYNLRAKAGESIRSLRSEARMWFFLSEGEKRLTEGKTHEALTEFLQARQQNDRSPIPLVKIGDMFRNLHALGDARVNYKMAADRAPQNIEIWSKYIDVLIQSYEWQEAEAAMDRFRKLPVQQSAIDKAAGDLYAKQQVYDQAETFYKRAMARDVIEQSVYMAYAKTLLAEGKFKDAPFFFALALRFDPLNTDAVIGTAKCVAGSESIERGIRVLQDQLQTHSGARAELLTAIAEMMIQKGDWDQAQKFVNDAIAANPEYATPWKVQAKIYLNKESTDKRAMDKALDAFKSYSDRNPSDPSGYMERYAIYVKRTEYEKASDELSKVFGIYPRYPNLHYFKGLLYAAMQNHKVALEELKLELTNNPRSVSAMIAMGKELMAVEQPQQALEFLNRAMSTDPKSGEAKHQAGYANFMMKNYQGAVALFNAALIYDKGNSQIYKRLAMAYNALGQTEDARAACKKYIEMEPDAPDRGDCDRSR